MRPALRRCSRLLVLAAFLVSIGMHAAVLQAVAWARMTVDFARRDTIAVSLEKTFDGRHPCPICVSLKKSAGPASLAAATAHSPLVFVPPSASPLVERVAVSWAVAPFFSSPLERASIPAGPPPKAVLS